MSTHELGRSRNKRSGLSLKVVLFGALCLLAMLLVGRLGWDVANAWRIYEGVSSQKEFDAGANRFIAGLFEVLMERLATNNALQASEPAASAVLTEIETRRKAVKENFDAGFAVLEAREFPNKQAVVQSLKTALQKANDYRKRADEALKQPRDRRDEDLRKTYIPVITDSVNAALKVWFAALYSTAKDDPALARLATIKELGFNMRDIAGMERSNIASAISAGAPIAADRIAANAAIRAQVDTLWKQLQNLTLDADTHPAIREAMAGASERYFKDFRSLADEMKKASEGGGKYSMNAGQWVDTTTPQLGTLLNVMYAAGKASEARASAEMGRASRELTIALVMLGLGLAIVIGSVFAIVRRVTRPLAALSGAMRKMADGNFDVALPGLERRDEIGQVAHAVDAFKLKAIEKAAQESDLKQSEAAQLASARKGEMQTLADGFEAAIGAIVASVSSASEQLESAAGTLTHSADNAQQLTGSVAAASEEASANVQSVAAATEELAHSVQEISRQVHESSKIAGEAVKQAEKTDARISELSQAAGRIGDVIKLITAIAEQTNLLALNATIEAARAGEAGRGFAVVAQEVKALAAQTAKATDEIGAQIAGMQTATQESVGAIKEISGTIAHMSDIASTIAAAVEQQGATTQEIARNVQHATQGTTQVATHISDVNKGARETGTASAQVLSSAQSLSQESSKLKTEVHKFLETVRAA